jgi:hypothetical protein
MPGEKYLAVALLIGILQATVGSPLQRPLVFKVFICFLKK